MSKRYTIAIIAILLLISTPAFAKSSKQELWSMGGGYWTLPNAASKDSKGNTLETSGFYGSLSMRSATYLLEGNYSITGSKIFAVAADYLYPVGQGSGQFSDTFIGVGYTYFTSEEFDNEKGFNVIGGTTFGDNIVGEIRYDFLGGSQEMFTIGLMYSF